MALPELKKKPSGVYYLDLRGQGLGRVSLNTRDRDVAVAKRRDIVMGVEPVRSAEPSRPRGNGPSMKELLSKAEDTVWRENKSQATIRSNIKILNGLIGDEMVSEMTFTRLDRLKDELFAMGYAAGTVKRKLDMVSKVLSMAASRWTDTQGRPLIPAKPEMPTVRVNNKRDRILSYKEEDQVFAAIEARRQKEPARQWARFAAMIRFLLDTGARLGEARQIGPADLSEIEVGEEAVTIVTFPRYRTKNDKPRSVPLTRAALGALRGLEGDLGEVGGKWVYFPLSSSAAWYMWSNIRDDLEALGFDVSDVTLHTLRHTCLSRLAKKGMDLRRLQMWAGHHDPKITAERYVHLRPEDLVAGIEMLASNPANSGNVIKTEPTAMRAAVGTVAVH